jgi:IrrE N-terminal-like domain
VDVPYLPENEIESHADQLLAEFNMARGLRLEAPIPVEELLERHLKLAIDFDDLHGRLGVPMSGDEPEVLGALWVDSREVFIDQSLDPVDNPEREGRYRFTLGHEIGHWRLHRDYLIGNCETSDLFGQVSRAPTVICRASQAKERVEWQADYFSSCLLMPRSLLRYWWREEFSRSTPLIFRLFESSDWAKPPMGWTGSMNIPAHLRDRVDPRAVSYFFYRASARIAPIFNVSIQATQIRLQNAGLLYIEEPRQHSIDLTG